jgi:hypothetical protein
MGCVGWDSSACRTSSSSPVGYTLTGSTGAPCAAESPMPPAHHHAHSWAEVKPRSRCGQARHRRPVAMATAARHHRRRPGPPRKSHAAVRRLQGCARPCRRRRDAASPRWVRLAAGSCAVAGLLRASPCGVARVAVVASASRRAGRDRSRCAAARHARRCPYARTARDPVRAPCPCARSHPADAPSPADEPLTDRHAPAPANPPHPPTPGGATPRGPGDPSGGGSPLSPKALSRRSLRAR